VTLLETDIFGVTHDKVQMAIDRIKTFEPSEGYYVAFSGGKDSVVILDLVKRSGVSFDAHYNLTTVDPPELVHFIKTFPDVQIHRPEKTMWQLIVKNGMPPLRQKRYCCRILKEHGGAGRKVVTGIRWAESNRRAKRKSVEACFRDDRRFYVNPIIEWSDADVWEYIRQGDVRYCSLYDEGWKRLGCVCCPNANQKQQAERWPKIANAYRRACVRAYDKAITDGKARTWKDGNDMFEWWISGQGSGGDPDQTVIFE
jgi:phosphoadenosine phosphosulfate reductase